MSLIPTHSMSAPRSYAARKTLRPIRPKPLIPTRTDIRLILPFSELSGKKNADFRRPRQGYLKGAAITGLSSDDLEPEPVGVAQVPGVVAAAVLRPLARC